MTAPALVGLDVGTTRVKAVAYTPDGAPLAVAERATPWLRSPEGVEMDADELTTVVRAVVAEACAGLPRVSGIGVTGMGEAGVLTGPDDARPLAPVRAWHDLRADVETIRIAYGEKEFRLATGMELDPQPSLPKILLLRRERPAAAAARRFWSVPEWAVRCLGGRPGSEWSLASRTGLLDVTAGTAWPGAIDLLGTDLLGELHPAGADCGRAAALPGAPGVAGAVLTVAGHDHQTAGLAAGATAGDTLLDSLGTAEALLRFTPTAPEREAIASLVANGITVGRTVVAGQYCLLAGLRTGFGLEELARTLGAPTRTDRTRLAGTPAWAEGVERLVAAADPALAAIRAAVGEPRAVIGVGGWLHDPEVLAAKRRRLPSLAVASVTEAGAAGAAYLAGVAAGLLPPAETITGPPWLPPAAGGPAEAPPTPAPGPTREDSP